MMEQEAAGQERGRGRRRRLTPAGFFSADRADLEAQRGRGARGVEILFVNPPAPDGGVWIRSQHRVGRRSREGMIWPQVGLAQMAALFPDYDVDIVDAIAGRLTWDAFEALLRDREPRIYVTQVAGPTLQNDMYGVFLAKSLGATTIAFGTHVTPLPRVTMGAYPALDYVLRGEPELALRELVDTLMATTERRRAEEEGRRLVGRTLGEVDDDGSSQTWWPDLDPGFARRLHKLFADSNRAVGGVTSADWRPAWASASVAGRSPLAGVKGLIWREGGEIVINADRPYIADLDDLPLPRHDLLPLAEYRAPLIGGPYAFVVTSRGCPGGCSFCIKHVSYGNTVRYRSPESVLAEIEHLVGLGVRDIHMYADLFTVNRGHVMGICNGILARGLDLRWTCNSRVDVVDPEMVRTMRRAGCWMIAWGIESGDEGMLRRMRKGTTLDQTRRALRWSKDAGIMNWGYFIIGLPGETEESIRRTIDLSKELPLDIALFHIAAPHPGTPFFFEVVENGWFRPDPRWEEIDMDRSTILDYPQLDAEDLERWARRAFREWALRPGPMVGYLRMVIGKPALWGAALEIGLESLGWARV